MTDNIESTSREPESFSRDYVRELREESKGWRLKADEQGQAARRARDEAAQAREQAAEAKRTADERVIRAELRAAATRAGIIDLDGLKLADLSGVSLDEDGAVQGADALLAGLRESKPYLFDGGTGSGGSGRGSSSNASPAPRPAQGGARHASTMSREEYERELKKLTRR